MAPYEEDGPVQVLETQAHFNSALEIGDDNSIVMIAYLDGSSPCDQVEAFVDQAKTEYKQVYYFKVYTCFTIDAVTQDESQKSCPYVQFYKNKKVHFQIDFKEGLSKMVEEMTTKLKLYNLKGSFDRPGIF